MTPRRDRRWRLALILAVAAGASHIAAQAPQLQTLGQFRWQGSIGSVLLQPAEDRLLVQVRVAAAQETRSLPTDAMAAWVLLENGSGLVATPREPSNDVVTFGFARPAGARVAAVVVKIDRQYHAFTVPAPDGADRPGREQPAMVSPAPYKAQPKQIEWSLSSVIQVLTLMDQGTFLRMELAGRSMSGFRGQPAPADLEGLQVWLLKNDGTAVRQRSPIRRAASSTAASWATHTEEVIFEHAPFQDLAALVLRAEGKLIIREIPRVRTGDRIR
jgi:hypothetical protein